MSEAIARKLHDLYEALAPSYGYETRKDTRDFDPRSPNGQLMIEVCSEVFGELTAEIERLREALEQIANEENYGLAGDWGDKNKCVWDVAREALRQEGGAE